MTVPNLKEELEDVDSRIAATRREYERLAMRRERLLWECADPVQRQLRALRDAAGWTQRKVADMLFVEQGKISTAENGVQPGPTFWLVCRYADLFGKRLTLVDKAERPAGVEA